MTEKSITNLLHPRRGIALVEFVLVAPMLLVMLLGVAELGRALYHYNTLTKAVRSGARYYAANVLRDQADAESKTILLVQYGNKLGSGDALLPPPLPVVSPVSVKVLYSTTVTVTATWDFSLLPGNPLSGILILLGDEGASDTWTMTSSVTLRAI